MSSDTSTTNDSLQPWQFFTLAGLIGATIVVFVSRGHTPAGIILLSLVIFAAAAVGVAAWRAFAPFAGKVDIDGPPLLAGRPRAALEREKALVLRSIKELEFDHAMGKVSEQDFADMRTRLRGRAARLMRELDAGASYRDQIKQEIEARVARATPKPDKARPATIECPHCGTPNDSDAKFCKSCGASLEATE